MLFSFSIFLGARLEVSTNRFACPFDIGFYGLDLICSIPLALQNLENSSEVKYEALSETNCSGTGHLSSFR